MIYTYSPNWYKPQCLYFKQDILYYCSNYILYQYNLPKKMIDRQKCFREIAIQYNLNHKDIKISAISSLGQCLFIGLNQPYLIILDIASLDVIRVVAIEGFETIEFIYPYRQQVGQVIVLCNKDGNLIKYAVFNQNIGLQKVDIRHKLSIVKAIYSIDNHHFAVFTRGTILIYNRDFTVLEKVIEASNSDSIYSVDCVRQQQKTFFVFLIKKKQSYSIQLFELKLKEQFPLQLKKRIGEIGVNIKQFDFNVYYPKKMSEKLKQNMKASLTIKLLDRKTVIVTGKLGQIFTINTQFIKNDEIINLKPFSYQQQPSQQYEVWADSRHYKQIYFIYEHFNRLYIISTDHNLTVWDRTNIKSIKYIYTLKFLTASVQSFFYSESDPRNMFALLKDSVVRSFTPFDQGSHQLNEYWKFSKKFKIKKALCHPTEQGILALATECNKIQIYDVYEDRLMKLIQIGQQLINISFEFPGISHELQKLVGFEGKQQKYKTVSHFIREMDNKTILLIQAKDNFIVVSDLSEKQLKYQKYPRAKKIQRIHENRYWDGQLLLSSQIKKDVLMVLMLFRQKKMQYDINLRYQQGRVLFKKYQDNNELNIINFKGCKFTLYKIIIDIQKQIYQIKLITQICLLNPIDYFYINYHDQRIAIYGQRDDCIIVMHLDRLTQQKYEINKSNQYAQLYWINTKIDSLMFYLQDYLITATKDQTIKIIKYKQLSELRKAQKKNGYITKLSNNLKQQKQP